MPHLRLSDKNVLIRKEPHLRCRPCTRPARSRGWPAPERQTAWETSSCRTPGAAGPSSHGPPAAAVCPADSSRRAGQRLRNRLRVGIVQVPPPHMRRRSSWRFTPSCPPARRVHNPCRTSPPDPTAVSSSSRALMPPACVRLGLSFALGAGWSPATMLPWSQQRICFHLYRLAACRGGMRTGFTAAAARCGRAHLCAAAAACGAGHMWRGCVGCGGGPHTKRVCILSTGAPHGKERRSSRCRACRTRLTLT